MQLSINTLCYTNNSSEMLEYHKKVYDKFEIPVNYTIANVRHGHFMDHVMRNVDADIFLFIDSDCVILDRSILDDCLEYVIENDSFIGPAQATNHIPPKSHIFAAPAFLMITKSCYQKLGSPSCLETARSDCAEELSYIAEEKAKRYRCIYPTMFDTIPLEGVWRLGNYGYYGIGTLFGDRIYHLYQGRVGVNVELFKKRCNQILSGSFDKSEMHSSIKEFNGKVVD
jgi:hypothetical protein